MRCSACRTLLCGFAAALNLTGARCCSRSASMGLNSNSDLPRAASSLNPTTSQPTSRSCHSTLGPTSHGRPRRTRLSDLRRVLRVSPLAGTRRARTPSLESSTSLSTSSFTRSNVFALEHVLQQAPNVGYVSQSPTDALLVTDIDLLSVLKVVDHSPPVPLRRRPDASLATHLPHHSQGQGRRRHQGGRAEDVAAAPEEATGADQEVARAGRALLRESVPLRHPPFVLETSFDSDIRFSFLLRTGRQLAQQLRLRLPCE